MTDDLEEMRASELRAEVRRLYGIEPDRRSLRRDELVKIVRQTRQRHTLDSALRADGGIIQDTDGVSEAGSAEAVLGEWHWEQHRAKLMAEYPDLDWRDA